LVEKYSQEAEKLMQLFYSRLSEKDRRHYAAMEAMKLGRGGTNYISELLGLDKASLIQGKKELTTPSELGQIPPGRQRRPGGGRKKKDRTAGG
jgi:hypothetical protein